MVLSFVIPCYGSEQTIGDVVDEIYLLLKGKVEYSFEIILVNDSSPDNVWNIIKQLCSMDKRIKGVNLSKNFGQQSALMAGFAQCSGDIIVTLDDDGQIPVNETFKLVNKIVNEKFDIVFASYEFKQHSKFRNCGTKLNEWLQEHLVGKPHGLSVTSFIAMERYIMEEILRYTNPYANISGLLFRTSRNMCNVLVKHRKRKVGKSTYTLRKLVFLLSNVITSFSVAPLRIATGIGSIFSILGFVWTLVIIFNKLKRPEIIVGWSSLVSIQLIIGGVVLIILGMIGEYVGRIYLCINNSPQYVVKEKINIT